MNDEPENLIVDGIEATYDLILDHHIRELIRLWDRADDASRETLISGTVVAVPLKKYYKNQNLGMITGF